MMKTRAQKKATAETRTTMLRKADGRIVDPRPKPGMKLKEHQGDLRRLHGQLVAGMSLGSGA
jgi:hypothetical protein